MDNMDDTRGTQTKGELTVLGSTTYSISSSDAAVNLESLISCEERKTERQHRHRCHQERQHRRERSRTTVEVPFAPGERPSRGELEDSTGAVLSRVTPMRHVVYPGRPWRQQQLGFIDHQPCVSIGYCVSPLRSKPDCTQRPP